MVNYRSRPRVGDTVLANKYSTTRNWTILWCLNFAKASLNYFGGILKLGKPKSISSHTLCDFNGTLIHMIVIYLYLNPHDISQELFFKNLRLFSLAPFL